MESSLHNKTILITGGTSRLGRAFVEKARAQGAAVFFTYHSGTQTAAALEALGARGFAVNLADMRAIDALAKELRATVKEGLDVLIHNAAATRDVLLRDMTEEDWDHVMTVDLKAPYYLTKKLLPLLFKKDPSKVLMITSRVGVQGGIGVSNYAAAKAGLIGLAKSLAQELGKKNVLINAVNPGFMLSAMTEDLPEEFKQKSLDDSLLGRVSNPEEVADFLVYLCTGAMNQVTGQVLHWESRGTKL